MIPLEQHFETFMRESNAIEGEYAPEWIEGITVWHPMTGVLHKNDISAMQYMWERASDDQAMYKEDLLAIFSLLAEDRKDLKTKNGYRKCNVRIGTHIPPDHTKVEKEMSEFFRWWYSMDAYQTHLMFERIHPFEDLNGCIGRIVWAWKMRQMGHDPFALPFLHKFYYQSLSSANMAGSKTSGGNT